MKFYEILAESQRGAVQAYLPGTRAQIIAGTGLTTMQVQHRLRMMHAAGEVHIGNYVRALGTSGRFSPVFYDGPGEDVECKLKMQNDKIYSRRWRKAHKDDEVMEARRKKDRQRYWEKRGAVADPLVSALFGRTSPKLTEEKNEQETA